jgi:hypothetical protein
MDDCREHQLESKGGYLMIDPLYKENDICTAGDPKTHNFLTPDGDCRITKRRCVQNILYCCACPAYMKREVVNYVGYKKERRGFR